MSLSLLAPIYNMVTKQANAIDPVGQALEAYLWLSSADRTAGEIDTWMAVSRNSDSFVLMLLDDARVVDVFGSSVALVNIKKTATTSDPFFSVDKVVAKYIAYLTPELNPADWSQLSLLFSDVTAFGHILNAVSATLELVSITTSIQVLSTLTVPSFAALADASFFSLFEATDSAITAWFVGNVQGVDTIASDSTVAAKCTESIPILAIIESDAYAFETLLPVGQEEYTVAGEYTFIVPNLVTSISAVAVGGGGGGIYSSDGGPAGGGGSLGWVANYSVTPGDVLSIEVGVGGSPGDFVSGSDGGASSVVIGAESAFVVGGEGLGAVYPKVLGTFTFFTGDGGGLGGSSSPDTSYGAGGGGAGGYSGAGGDGYNAGTGGGGGGGNGGGSTDTAGSGGGVGIYGEGVSGGVGPYTGDDGYGGYGGSGGEDGGGYGNLPSGGGNFGGGGAGSDQSVGELGSGGSGAVRIIWGSGRSYPSTRTEDE